MFPIAKDRYLPCAKRHLWRPGVAGQSPLVVAGLAAGALCSWSSAVLRRSLSFMLIGVLIAVPILLTANAAQTDWPPHKIVLIAVVTVASACIMALVDELALDGR
jgi:uncharacterized membrane protein YbjE (DUF340 family)